MNIRGTPDLGQPSDDPISGGERQRIRQRMKMVIGQLEGILWELKEVAKELREVSERPVFLGLAQEHTFTCMFLCVCLCACAHAHARAKLCVRMPLCWVPPSPFPKSALALLKISQ